MPGTRRQKKKNTQTKTKNNQTKAARITPIKTTHSKKTANPPAAGAGKKRKCSNQQEATNLATKEKRQKTRSLTTADIPDIVSAIVNTLLTSDAGTTLHTTCTRWTTGSDTRPVDKQPSRRQDSSNQQESSSSNSGEDADSEEFGKS